MKESLRTCLGNVVSEVVLRARVTGHIFESLRRPNTNEIIKIDRASREIRVVREEKKL